MITTRHAHADYYLAFAAGVAADIQRTRQLEAVRRARIDNANTLAAIRWFTGCALAGEQGATEKGLLFCGYLNWVWHIGGQHFTARDLMDPLLGLAVDTPPSRGRALARLAAGMISTVTGEWGRSLIEWTGGTEDGRAVGDAEVAAEGLMGVGYCCLSLGRMEESRAALDESIALSAGGVSDFIHALSLTMKGMLLFVTGDLEPGMALIEEARRIQERLNDCEGGGIALSFLAQMSFAKGDQHARALALYGGALDLLSTVGDQPEVARVHCEMGWTALAAGDAAAAQYSFCLGVQTNQEVGSAKGTGLALLGLAAVEAAEVRPGTRRRVRRRGTRVERACQYRHRPPDGPGRHQSHRRAQSVDPEGQPDGRGERQRAVAGRGSGDGQPGRRDLAGLLTTSCRFSVLASSVPAAWAACTCNI